MDNYTLRVELNGTNENPWHRFALTQNPFPQIAKAEYHRQCLRVQGLGGNPIPDVQYIRNYLRGYASDEFIELCCANFKKGKIVRFTVTFDEAS
jgi:hypothetical protein